MNWDAAEYGRLLARVQLDNARPRRRSRLARAWDRWCWWWWSFAR